MHAHRDYVEGCFKCKLGTLSFGVVPGAYRDTNSASMFDKDALLTQLSDRDGNPVFNEERVNDMRSTFDRKVREFNEA